MYLIFIQNNKIMGSGQCECLNEEIKNIEVSEELYNSFNENPELYIWDGEEIIIDTDYEEKQAQKEQERINNLTMTPLDFIGVLQSLGLTLEQINEFLESNLNIKMQLTYCNSVYCGVVKSFLPITIEGITITPEMVESAFIAKNGGM